MKSKNMKSKNMKSKNMKSKKKYGGSNTTFSFALGTKTDGKTKRKSNIYNKHTNTPKKKNQIKKKPIETQEMQVFDPEHQKHSQSGIRYDSQYNVYAAEPLYTRNATNNNRIEGITYYLRSHGLGWKTGDTFTLPKGIKLHTFVPIGVSLRNLSGISADGKIDNSMSNNIIAKEFYKGNLSTYSISSDDETSVQFPNIILGEDPDNSFEAGIWCLPENRKLIYQIQRKSTLNSAINMIFDDIGSNGIELPVNLILNVCLSQLPNIGEMNINRIRTGFRRPQTESKSKRRKQKIEPAPREAAPRGNPTEICGRYQTTYGDISINLDGTGEYLTLERGLYNMVYNADDNSIIGKFINNSAPKETGKGGDFKFVFKPISLFEPPSFKGKWKWRLLGDWQTGFDSRRKIGDCSDELPVATSPVGGANFGVAKEAEKKEDKPAPASNFGVAEEWV